jgi:hypothetical protein
MICRCLLKVLCPVRRPKTTLDCVPLKDNSRAPLKGKYLEEYMVLNMKMGNGELVTNRELEELNKGEK